MKPLAIDLFCGQGGASMGLQRAGFDVIGVDLKRMPRYPFLFVQGDATRPPVDLRRADLIWASPLCQAHTSMRGMWNGREKRGLSPHLDLIPVTRELLIASGRPYVIENVPGAPLRTTIQLCGTMFGLGTNNGAQLQRHRWFETSFLILQPACDHRTFAVGVYGEGARDRTQDRRRTISITGHAIQQDLRHVPPEKREVITITGRTPQQNVVKNITRNTYTVNDARDAMGMPWATMAGLSQAIPPAYSEFIGRAALAHLGLDRAA